MYIDKILVIHCQKIVIVIRCHSLYKFMVITDDK